MQRTMLKSKIHRATVTGSDLHYVGSITIDPDLLEAADILAHEQVAVVDVDNGARFETYTIPGERGSGTVQVNGAAARLVHTGDTVIVISYAEYDEAELTDYDPASCTWTRATRSSTVDAEVDDPAHGGAIAMSAVPNVTVSRDTGRLPVTLPALAEKKRLGEPIVMVTAYDYPSAQVAEAAGVDMVLVGDSGAMTVLGYDSTVPVSVDEMLMLASAARRGLRDAVPGRRPAVRLLRGVRRAGRGHRAAVRQGGAAATPSSSRAAARSVAARPGDRRGRDPGHGPRRPDPADRHRARRLPGPGPHRPSGRCRSPATRSRCRRPAASRSSSRRSPPPWSPALMPRMEIPVIGIGAGAGDRRPGAGVPRPARDLRRASARGSPSATPSSRPRWSPASPPTPTRCARAPSRGRSTSTRSIPTELEAFVAM